MTPKIKAIIAGIGALILAAIVGILLYAHAQGVKYQQAIGASEVLTAEYEAYKASAEGLISGLSITIRDLEAQREAALAAANQAAQSQAATQAALDKLKAETAALPATDLSIHINARIGSGNSWPTAGGLFSFTRIGTENTLNLFYTGEASAKQYADEQVVSSNLRIAVDACAGEVSAWSQKYALKDGEYTRALAAWDMDKSALKFLRRSLFGRTVKTFVIGAGAGAVAVIIYTLVKGK